MNTITIDIIRSLSARKFQEDERIHYDAFNRACILINSQLKEIVDGDFSTNDETDRSLEESPIFRKYGTISVFGDRGVGKTSFLLSLRDKYIKNDSISVMPFIDPTLIEEKGHVFLLIVGIIDEMVQSHLKSEHESVRRQTQEREWSAAKKTWHKDCRRSTTLD